jgi:hypothetical protein
MITIAQFTARRGADSDFSPTLPPPVVAEAPLALDALDALDAVEARDSPGPQQRVVTALPLDIQSLRVSVLDVESQACIAAWSIGDEGEGGPFADAGGSAGFTTAMATIVHLNRTPVDQTLTRQLDPQRWAFAWRVNSGRVAVAEARYRWPTNLRPDKDTAAVRQLCAAGIETGPLRFAEARNDHRPFRESDAPAADATPQTAGQAAPAGWADSLAPWLRGPQLLGLGLAGAIGLLGALQVDASRRGEALRMRQLTDATMTQQLTRGLAVSDYGEVQGDLEAFERLGYFKGAVVVDARQRAVASVGAVPALRIGQVVALPDTNVARVLQLPSAAGSTAGQLLIWGSALTPPRASALIVQALYLASPLLLVAALAGAALKWRQRQHGTGAPQPLLSPPDTEAPP